MKKVIVLIFSCFLCTVFTHGGGGSSNVEESPHGKLVNPETVSLYVRLLFRYAIAVYPLKTIQLNAILNEEIARLPLNKGGNNDRNVLLHILSGYRHRYFINNCVVPKYKIDFQLIRQFVLEKFLKDDQLFSIGDLYNFLSINIVFLYMHNSEPNMTRFIKFLARRSCIMSLVEEDPQKQAEFSAYLKNFDVKSKDEEMLTSTIKELDKFGLNTEWHFLQIGK